MIKRTYFMSVEKPHDDGSGSYSFMNCTASKRSLFPDAELIYTEMYGHLREKLKDQPGKSLMIIAFNRV